MEDINLLELNSDSIKKQRYLYIIMAVIVLLFGLKAAMYLSENFFEHSDRFILWLTSYDSVMTAVSLGGLS